MNQRTSTKTTVRKSIAWVCNRPAPAAVAAPTFNIVEIHVTYFPRTYLGQSSPMYMGTKTELIPNTRPCRKRPIRKVSQVVATQTQSPAKTPRNDVRRRAPRRPKLGGSMDS